jgi:hypothetical protein
MGNFRNNKAGLKSGHCTKSKRRPFAALRRKARRCHGEHVELGGEEQAWVRKANLGPAGTAPLLRGDHFNGDAVVAILGVVMLVAKAQLRNYAVVRAVFFEGHVDLHFHR